MVEWISNTTDVQTGKQAKKYLINYIGEQSFDNNQKYKTIKLLVNGQEITDDAPIPKWTKVMIYIKY